MAASQSHGFLFEQFVRSRLQASQPDDRLRAPVANPTSFFDIQTGALGPGIAGSIKTSAVSARVNHADCDPASVVATVALADARRVWSWPYLANMAGEGDSRFPSALRLIVGAYSQEANEKIFNWVYEIDLVFDDATKAALFGAMSFGDVFAFHAGLGFEFFPEGEHVAARAWAKKHKKALKEARKLGAIDLNFKIDSNKQRRLQCTISLPELLKAAHAWRVNKGPFSWDLPMLLTYVDDVGVTRAIQQDRGPLRVPSPPRARKKKSAEGQPAS